MTGDNCPKCKAPLRVRDEPREEHGSCPACAPKRTVHPMLVLAEQEPPPANRFLICEAVESKKVRGPHWRLVAYRALKTEAEMLVRKMQADGTAVALILRDSPYLRFVLPAPQKNV